MHRTSALLAPLVVSTLLLFGCSDNGTPSVVVSTASYSKDCKVDADCTTVFSGDVCAVCAGCPNDAISAADGAKFQAEYDAAKASCGAKDTSVSCAPCSMKDARCVGGRCTP